MNTRFRFCPATTPSFMESELLCYDTCPVGYYSVPTHRYCAPCHYSCLECSDARTCSSCDASSHRSLNLTTSLNGIDGQCSCLSYYYDDGTNRNCGSCHYSCLYCYNSLVTSCLTCNTSDYRFMSYITTVNNVSTTIGRCNCGPSYFENGVSQCSQCHYTCLTCSSQNVCLTCPVSRTLNQATHTCDCITGYTDYGSAKCEK